jgi:hypothetical protein
MRRVAVRLAEIETDEEPTADRRELLIRSANRWRADHGISPLKDELGDPPELELYRRARALGLGHRRR